MVEKKNKQVKEIVNIYIYQRNRNTTVRLSPMTTVPLSGVGEPAFVN